MSIKFINRLSPKIKFVITHACSGIVYKKRGVGPRMLEAFSCLEAICCEEDGGDLLASWS